jgi:hypothetical protein
MQLVDGMDNASPLLNFVLGNLIEFQRLMFKVWSYFQEHLLLYMVPMHLMVFYDQSKPIHKSGITAYAKFGQTSQKLLDKRLC